MFAPLRPFANSFLPMFINLWKSQHILWQMCAPWQPPRAISTVDCYISATSCNLDCRMLLPCYLSRFQTPAKQIQNTCINLSINGWAGSLTGCQWRTTDSAPRRCGLPFSFTTLKYIHPHQGWIAAMVPLKTYKNKQGRHHLRGINPQNLSAVRPLFSLPVDRRNQFLACLWYLVGAG